MELLIRLDHLVKLPSPVDAVAVDADDLLVVDLTRLWPAMDPEKMSPFDEPGIAAKMFLEMESRLKMPRDRVVALGVAGLESAASVLNLKRPY